MPAIDTNSLEDLSDTATGRIVSGGELRRRLQQILASAKRLGSVHAVGLIEIEPDTPPRVLRRIVTSMCRRIRQSDTLAELDDNRYGLILHHCPLDNAVGVARSLLATIRTGTDDDTGGQGEADVCRAVIGLVPFSAETSNTYQLLDHGRRACTEAWALGGDRVQVFQSEGGDRARKEHQLQRAAELSQAIEGDHLLLYGQEIVPLKPDLPRHIEVLMRMPDGEGGVIRPAAFVLAAERYGIADRLDQWVVNKVLASYRRLFGDSGVGVTINLSAKSIGDDKLLDLVRRHDVPAERVCFEITETAAIRDLESARAFIDALRQLGCRFALDDFGSGHASFLYLKELEVDYLKIDQGFVRDVLEQDFDLAMVAAVNKIGQVLGIRVIAEGVENHDILKRIRDVGLDYAQGYVHGLPSPLEDLAKLRRRAQLV